MDEFGKQPDRLTVLLGELLAALAAQGGLKDQERWAELRSLLHWDGQPVPSEVTRLLRLWLHGPNTVTETARKNPVWYAVKLLAGGRPDQPQERGNPPLSAVGWDAERKVLSVRQHSGEWMNLWLEADDGDPHAESDNRAAAGTVALWASNDRTRRAVEQEGYPLA